MQDNTVNVAGDSCAVCCCPCTSHGIIGCVGKVVWAVIAPSGVLSRGCLFSCQQNCIDIVVERQCGDCAYGERLDFQRTMTIF